MNEASPYVAIAFFAIYGIMCAVPLLAIILLGYGNATGNMKPFYKFYGFLLGVKYAPARSKTRRKNNRRRN